MPDVIVVGAGFAGLSAATALVESGADVLVVEARPGLGGRASSFRDPATGEVVDNGQHVLIGCYHETLRFLARIGAATAVHRQDGLHVSMIDRAGVATTLALPPLPSPLHLAAGVMAWRALDLRDRVSLLGIAPALLRARAALTAEEGLGRPRRRALPGTVVEDITSAVAESPAMSASPPSHADETVRAWLTRHGQSSRLCELLWEPLALAALNQPIDHAAAVSFVAVLARMFGSDPADAALILPARPLSELYAEPARRWIEARGGRVRTQSPARVIVDGGIARGVRVRDEVVSASAVICAVPWFALHDIFEGAAGSLAETLDHAARTPAVPIATVNLWLDRPVLDGPLVGLPGRAFQWVFDRRTIVGDEASHLSLVSSGATDMVAMGNTELVDHAWAELRAALPAARAAIVRKASAVRERRATFSLAPGLPPRPATETSIEGLFLAGDWIDTGLPATIESAVVSGHRAAVLALSQLQQGPRPQHSKPAAHSVHSVDSVRSANLSNPSTLQHPQHP